MATRTRNTVTITIDPARVEAALRAFGSANFDAGEWDSADSDVTYDETYGAVMRAERRLRNLLGLPAPECEACHGRGRIDNRRDLLGTETCPTCGGSGRR